MKGCRRATLVLALALGGSGCAPLTFSGSGDIDFEIYRSVYVDVRSGIHEPRATDYLANELAHGSGFETVTIDPSAATSVELLVDLSLSTSTENDGSLRYDAHASFQLVSGGAIVDQGSENNGGDFPDEAIDDVLDDVSLHYIAPYRR
jgi:hypothetical protein